MLGAHGGELSPGIRSRLIGVSGTFGPSIASGSSQVSRSPNQVQLRRLLRGCEIVPFAEADAHRAGALLGKAGFSDVVDAAVVALAIGRRADIQSGDARDIRRLLAAAGAKLRVLEV